MIYFVLGVALGLVILMAWNVYRMPNATVGNGSKVILPDGEYEVVATELHLDSLNEVDHVKLRLRKT